MEGSSGQQIIDVVLPTYHTEPEEHERFVEITYPLLSILFRFAY